LVGDIGVGTFERRTRDRARGALDRRSGLRGRRIGLAVERLQVVRAVEVRQRDLGEVDVLPVGEGADHEARVVDGDRLELTGGKAVLGDRADGRVAGGGRKLRQRAGGDVESNVTDLLIVDREVRDGDATARRAHQVAVRVEGEG